MHTYIHVWMDGFAFETLFFFLSFVAFALLGLGEIGLAGLRWGAGLAYRAFPYGAISGR
jgi:hypothetical protein